MQQSRYQVEDSALEAERRLRYQGSARISLDVLQFGWDQQRELDPGHVEFLKKCFRNEDCERLPAENHVPAIIGQQQLANAMRDSGVSVQQLLAAGPLNGYPSLEFPTGVKLECLHGLHRIEAGREFLLPTEKWWIVDLYPPDLDTNLRLWLVERYSNERKLTDGEIYRKLRQYDAERNLRSKLRWKSRLRGIRPKSLNTLYKHDDLTDGFDALLDIPGLWHDMKLSTIHKLFPLRCNKKILHYLRHIKAVWSGLVEGNKDAMSRIDKATVQALQMRAPRASTTDASMLRSQLRAGEIFHAFNDSEREDIWSKLQMVEGLIPSFYTLFRDVQYLEDCVNCVKRLTALSPGESLSNAMKRRFTGVNQRQGQLKIQVAEDKFIYRQGTPEDQVDFGCRQIHAFAMRNWPDMPKEPEIEDPQMKPPTKANLATLRRFADLAAELGFQSDQITNLQQYPGRGNAPAEHPQSRPILVTSEKGVPIKKRCGKPSTREFRDDRQCLFISHLHDERHEQGSNVTSFFVRKSVYFAFFGKPLATHDSGQTDETSPDRSPQGSGIDVSNCSPIDNTSQSHRSLEHPMEYYDGILTLYQQRDARSEQRAGSNLPEERAAERAEGSIDVDSMQDCSEEQEQERREQERLEQEGLELRRREERLEREDLQARLTHGLQAQENLEQEKRRQQEQEKREQERQEEERRRQETREQGRREQEKTVKDSEHTRKRYTEINMESVVSGAARNQGQAQGQQAQTNDHHTGQEITGSNFQSGRDLVVADPSSDTARSPRTPVNDQTGRRRESLERDSLERVRQEQERLEQERLEREKLEQERLELERLAQEGLAQERLEQESRERERLEQERLEQERLERERLKQERLELRRIEEGLEREDLQERLTQALQAQENTERETQRQREQDKREQERQEEERRRQETREQGRREQERTLKDSERTRKRYTQIDMKSIVSGITGNQGQAQTNDRHIGQETAGSNLQSGRELVLADPNLDTARSPRTSVNNKTGRRRESLERERLERVRQEQERLEQERLELERLAQERLAQEGLAQERLEQESRERERLEQERLEQERLEREKRDQEKRVQERLERVKLQERLAQRLQEQEKLEQEKRQQKKREHDLPEQEKREVDRREKERQRQERREHGRWEQQKTIQSEGSLEPTTRPRPRRQQFPTPLVQMPDSVCITFMVRERDVWRTVQSRQFPSSDPSEIERIAVKYMRKQMVVFDTNLDILTPEMCFQAAIANGSNMLLLIPEREININKELEASVSQLLSRSGSQIEVDIE